MTERKKAIELLRYANRMSSLTYMGGIDSTSERIVLSNFHHLVGIKNPSYSERELSRFCNIILSKHKIRTIEIKENNITDLSEISINCGMGIAVQFEKGKK